MNHNTTHSEPYPLTHARHDRRAIALARATNSATVRVTITYPRTRWTLHRAWLREWMGALA
jgi:predicted nuclease with RNAse H fold